MSIAHEWRGRQIEKCWKNGKKGLTFDIIIIEGFGCVVKLLEVSLDRIGAESTPAVELFRHDLRGKEN